MPAGIRLTLVLFTFSFQEHSPWLPAPGPFQIHSLLHLHQNTWLILPCPWLYCSGSLEGWSAISLSLPIRVKELHLKTPFLPSQVKVSVSLTHCKCHYVSLAIIHILVFTSNYKHRLVFSNSHFSSQHIKLNLGNHLLCKWTAKHATTLRRNQWNEIYVDHS